MLGRHLQRAAPLDNQRRVCFRLVLHHLLQNLACVVQTHLNLDVGGSPVCSFGTSSAIAMLLHIVWVPRSTELVLIRRLVAGEAPQLSTEEQHQFLGYAGTLARQGVPQVFDKTSSVKYLKTR